MKLAMLALLLMAPAFSKDWRTGRHAYRRAVVEARASRREARREVRRARMEARRETQAYRLELRREIRGAVRREPADTSGMHRIF